MKNHFLSLTLGVSLSFSLIAPSRPLAQDSTPFPPGGSAQELEIDRQHFRDIFKAIQAYRKDHNDELPDWLSDLFPKYMTDQSVLISSLEKRSGMVGPFHIEDPKIHTSYNYEFNGTPASQFISGAEAARMTMKQWKLKQTQSFGTVVPIVRFIWPNNGSLNLAYSGEIFEARIGWETDPRTLALVKKLRESGSIKAGDTGRTMQVRVCEVQGDKPLGGAEVRVEVQNQYGYQPLQVLTTDAEGTCAVRLPEGSIIQLGVQARKPGFVSLREGYDESAVKPTNVTLRLSPALTAMGLVQDNHERPVANARIEFPEANDSTTTDASGKWTFSGIPQDFGGFTVLVSHPDFRPERVLSATTNVVTTLTRLLIVQGSVKEALTGAPIDEFTVIAGFNTDRQVQWDLSGALPGHRGVFNLRYQNAAPAFLKIQARGYEAAVSPRLAETGEDLKLSFALRKCRPITGEVIGLDERPVAGARIALLTESGTLALARGEFMEPTSKLATTDNQGRFEIPSDAEMCSVLVAHSSGFAQVTIEDLAVRPKIRLAPWSGLTAEASSGGSADTLLAVTADVLLPQLTQNPCPGRLTLDFNSFFREAPDSGRTFRFDFIPPGRRVLWQAVRINDEMGDNPGNVVFVGTPFIAKPGEIGRLNLASNSGRLTAILRLNKPIEFTQALGILRYKRPSATEGEERYFTVNDSGVFRIDNLPPDATDWELVVCAPPILIGNAKGFHLQTGVSKSIASIDVSPIEGRSSGELAPLIEGRTLDGQPFRLADFRGKPVLLEFWSSTANPGFSSTPHLTKVWRKYGTNGKLEVVGLNLDVDIDLARQFARRLGMSWKQVSLGHWSQTTLPAQFGVRSLPAAVLLDPNGRIAAANIESDQILESVEEALGVKKAVE